jgi:penicillin-insensitive murein DD-endopeptidase
MRFAAILRCALVSIALCAGLSGTAGAQERAQQLFGNQRLPAATQPQVHGTYSKGCFSGGIALATDGPQWQSMRLSRNRRWGHPEMVSLIERLSREATQDGWPGLLVGDISQPRGGPMLSGHASHQIGLDADIWFLPMPDRRLSDRERENLEFVSLLRPNSLQVDDRKWSPAHAGLLRRAASYSNVERVLVHPGIKKKLCDTVTGDRSWLGKVRPIWGHDSHFHIRIGCPAGSPGCRRQEPVATGTGCDASLDWWFTDEPWRQSSGPAQPRARDVMTMGDLPQACQAVLAAPAPASEEAVTLFSGASVPTTASAVPPVAASAFAPLPQAAIPIPQPRPN